MRVCAITMVHNEPVNLPIWLGHYGRAFGFENLYVIDHGTTDGSTDQLPAGVNRIRIPRDGFDDVRRRNLIRELFSGLRMYFDYCVYSDVDELLVVDPLKADSLSAYIAGRGLKAFYAIGLNVWHEPGREPPLDPSQPVLSQRRLLQFESALCKPLIGRKALHWTPGFHQCQYQPELDDGLYLIHTKYADMGGAMDRLQLTRNMSWSEEAVARGVGRHQRRSDEEQQALFAETARQAAAGQLRTFDFGPEIAAINERSFANADGVWIRPKLKAFLTTTPERFRTLV